MKLESHNIFTKNTNSRIKRTSNKWKKIHYLTKITQRQRHKKKKRKLGRLENELNNIQFTHH